MEEFVIQTDTQTNDGYSLSLVSEQLEQDYRRYTHRLDEEVIG